MDERTLLIDTRQQANKHNLKEEWWASHGVSTVRMKLDFGDYMVDGSNVSVDTKRDVAEIAQNIGGKEHARFRRELMRARDAGYKLVILVENTEGIKDVSDLPGWTNRHCVYCKRFIKRVCNPHLSTKCVRHGKHPPIQGERLAKAMATMHERYGVDFKFCKPQDTARIVCELLGIDYSKEESDVRD